MNYFLSSRNEIRTPQITLSYSGHFKNFKVFTIEIKIEKYPVGISFDVPWADDAFFDTLASIGRELLALGEKEIKTVYAYENEYRIVIQIDDKMWQFKKPSPPEGDTTPNPPT